MSSNVAQVGMLAQASRSRKNKAAQEMARKRSRKLTPERRSEIASQAAKARWAKLRKK